MSRFFNLAAIKDGDIFHSHTDGIYASAIRAVLGSKGSHDGLMIYTHAEGHCVGEALPTGGALTSLSKYEDLMAAGKTRVAIFRMPEATWADGTKAWFWFSQNIHNAPYNFVGVGKIFVRRFFGRSLDWLTGSEWRWYCTEAVRDAWTKPPMSKNYDVWRKDLPTPRTTEKRVEEGLLLDVSAQCLTEAGQKHRLMIGGSK